MARSHCNDTSITALNCGKLEDWINGLSDVHACLDLVLRLQIQYPPKPDIKPTVATLINLLMSVMRDRLEAGGEQFLNQCNTMRGFAG